MEKIRENYQNEITSMYYRGAYEITAHYAESLACPQVSYRIYHKYLLRPKKIIANYER
jgi:hypothetical protein